MEVIYSKTKKMILSNQALILFIKHLLIRMVYPSLEEKAANLVYLITKNHSFSDGNKRIAATLFLYLLNKNGVLFEDREKLIDDCTLVAITIMIAESKPEEKETIIKLIMNFLS